MWSGAIRRRPCGTAVQFRYLSPKMKLIDVFNKQRRITGFYNYLFKLQIGNSNIFFSFGTPIAVHSPQLGLIKVADDFWGKFTHFHLKNLEEDKDKRVSREYLDFHIRKIVKQEIDMTTFPWDDFRGVNIDPYAIRRRGIEEYGL